MLNLRFITLILFVLGIGGCITYSSGGKQNEINKANKLKYHEDPDGKFPDDWFDKIPSQEESISLKQAIDFANSVFNLIDRKFFDPTIRLKERKKARLETISSLQGIKKLTRKQVNKVIQEKLRIIGVSHLHLLNPSDALTLTKRTKPNKSKNAVSVLIKGEIGILKIESFLVPEIDVDQIKSAFKELQSAKALLIDLRGNGGGSISPIVYTAQYLVGANKTIKYSKTRWASEYQKPFIKNGFFPDENNHASKSDVRLQEDKGFVEWRTPLNTPQFERRPTYLLIDSDCGSACDVFVSLMKEHNVAKILGQKTAGAVLGGLAFRPEWKGYLLIIPTIISLSPNKKSYEGIGVEPHVTIQECKADDKNKNNQCLSKAIDIIKRENLSLRL